MNIGKLFKNLPSEFNNHKFSSLSFNSKICKNGDIFFSIKGKKIGNPRLNKGGKRFKKIFNGISKICKKIK